jgi:hypothetical protein
LICGERIHDELKEQLDVFDKKEAEKEVEEMKLKLTIEEAEQIACALCFGQIELEAHAHEMDRYTEDRSQVEEAAQFYEQMCKRFREAAEKSKGSVTVDIE